MALNRINAVCLKCDHHFTVIPTRSFLGFQKLTCPKCHENLTYPLTKGYRNIYWVILCIMIVSFIFALTQGKVSFPGILGIAAIIALIKDKKIKDQISIKGINYQ